MEGGGKKKEINVAADKSASWEDDGERRGTTLRFSTGRCVYFKHPEGSEQN